MKTAPHRLTACVLLALATACSPDAGMNGTAETYAGVGADETVSLIGTEPFWGLTITGAQARYSTPDRVSGAQFTVSRFAGNNGLGFSGTLDDAPLTATLTPGQCSDGMSDRSYPFTATIVHAGMTMQGCGYTSAKPFTGEGAP